MKLWLTSFLLYCLWNPAALAQTLDVQYDSRHPNELRASITDISGADYTLSLYQRSSTGKWKSTSEALADYTSDDEANISTRDFNMIMARMRSVDASNAPNFAKSDKRNTLFMELSQSGKALDTAALRFGPMILTRDIAAPNIKGRLYTPSWATAQDRLPLAVVLGGSEGGYSNQLIAARLATENYLVLSVAYFGVAGTPSCLADIEINDLTALLARAQKAPIYDGQGYHLISMSRGGEYASLYAEAHPDGLRSLTLVAPDAHVNAFTGCKTRPPSDAAWTLNDGETDYVPIEQFPTDKRAEITAFEKQQGGRDWSFIKRIRASIYPDDVLENAKIPLKNLEMPVLVVIGDQDKTSNFTRFITPADYGQKTRVEIIEGAGHQIFRPPFQTADGTDKSTRNGKTTLYGGTDEVNAQARFKMWNLMLAHMETNR